jgi:hypothetical protein
VQRVRVQRCARRAGRPIGVRLDAHCTRLAPRSVLSCRTLRRAYAGRGLCCGLAHSEGRGRCPPAGRRAGSEDARSGG